MLIQNSNTHKIYANLYIQFQTGNISNIMQIKLRPNGFGPIIIFLYNTFRIRYFKKFYLIF